MSNEMTSNNPHPKKGKGRPQHKMSVADKESLRVSETIDTFLQPGARKHGYSHAFVTHMSAVILDVLAEEDVEEAEMRIRNEFLRLLDSPILSKMMRIYAHGLNPAAIREEVIKFVKLYE